MIFYILSSVLKKLRGCSLVTKNRFKYLVSKWHSALIFWNPLVHINPYQIADQDFWLQIQTFIWTLIWRPAGTIQIVIGSILIIKSLKR